MLSIDQPFFFFVTGNVLTVSFKESNTLVPD